MKLRKDSVLTLVGLSILNLMSARAAAAFDINCSDETMNDCVCACDFSGEDSGSGSMMTMADSPQDCSDLECGEHDGITYSNCAWTDPPDDSEPSGDQASSGSSGNYDSSSYTYSSYQS
jgi:hypothetical protein